MKKTILFLTVVLLLAGCASKGNDGEKGAEGKVDKEVEQQVGEETLSLQLLKADEEAGITIENSEVYKELNRMITENADMGLANDFSINIIDIVDSGTENASLLFLAINRLDEPMKNITFDYTLGHDNGEFVWKGVEVNLSEQETGIIQPNHAVPFTLSITPEQEALIDTLEQDNQVGKMDNFKFESVN